MDPPPAPGLPAVTPAANLPSTSSNKFSPHSRETDSCDRRPAPVPAAPKLRLVCSHGGHIVPRLYEKYIIYCYVGGDNRLVVVDRNISIAELYAKIAKTLSLRAESFSLKYQLPNEDLDSLLSLIEDEDLEVMIEEYDRFGKSRLRLFVFPAKSASSASSIGSLLEGSVNSDEWFFRALNGFPDSEPRNDQGIQSVPESNMIWTTSSMDLMKIPEFANLPPIRVRKSLAHYDDHIGEMPGSNQTTVAASVPIADNARTGQNMEVALGKKPVQYQDQHQHQKLRSVVDSRKPDMHPSDGSLPDAMHGSYHMGCQEAVMVSSGPSRTFTNQVNEKNNFMDGNIRVQLLRPVQESGYMVQPCYEMSQQSQHYSQQQQVVYYVVQQPDNPMPMAALHTLYPQKQAQHQHHQSIPLRQPHYPLHTVQAPQDMQGYSMVTQQATHQEDKTGVHPQTSPISSIPESAAFQIYHNAPAAQSSNPELVSAIYGATTTTTTVGAPPMIQVGQEQFVNYSQVNNQPQTVSSTIPACTCEIPDPVQAQIYFTQPPPSFSVVSQYQTTASSQGFEVSDQPQNNSNNPSQS